MPAMKNHEMVRVVDLVEKLAHTCKENSDSEVLCAFGIILSKYIEGGLISKENFDMVVHAGRFWQR